MKVVVAAFNQEKALVGAFSVNVRLRRLIVNSTNINIWDAWCHLCSCLHVHTWPSDHSFTSLTDTGHCARPNVNIWNKWCYTELTWRWQSTPQSLMTDEKCIMKLQRNPGIYCLAQLWVLNEVYSLHVPKLQCCYCDLWHSYLVFGKFDSWP